MKNSKLNCIIGDVVEFDEDEKVITKIFERKNYLYRPLLSNIDFIGILFAIENPKFDFTRLVPRAFLSRLKTPPRRLRRPRAALRKTWSLR